MTLLWKRAARLAMTYLNPATNQVSNTDQVLIEHKVDRGNPRGLDFIFDVKRSLEREPNTAEIQVWNLNPDRQAALKEKRLNLVTLHAGYEEDQFLLFQGDVDEVVTERDGADVVTKISATDGGRAYRGKRVSLSFSKGATVKSVVDQLVDTLASGSPTIGIGNVKDISGQLRLPNGSTRFDGGVVIHGNGLRHLERILRACGYRLSFQDSILQAFERGRSLSSKVTVLNSDRGLVEAPARSNKGIVTATSLIINDLYPGRLVEFKPLRPDLNRVEGTHRILTSQFRGDTAGPAWYCTMEAREL